MPTWEIRVGDARAELAKMAAGSCQVCVTSPPYFGLRSYSTAPQVWGGDGSCGDEHGWVTTTRKGQTGGDGNTSGLNCKRDDDGRFAHDSHAHGTDKLFTTVSNATCLRCGAWRGELGAEPTVDAYVAHLVEVFREVRRVLRDDGVCWIVLGDSYATDTAGWRKTSWSAGDSGIKKRSGAPGNLKPKDLIGIPFAVAFALRDDAWYLRSALPWLKRNCMPESVQDRPTSAVEYVFLVSKQARYFWDAEAVKRSIAPSSFERWGNDPYTKRRPDGLPTFAKIGGETTCGVSPSGRSFRNSDLFYDSLALTADDYTVPAATSEPANAGPAFASLGLILDEDGDPLALDVNPTAFSGAHFACFPPKLVEPLIKATTSERGCCANPGCGAPYRRVVERMSVSASDGETNGRYSSDPSILSASSRGVGKSRQHYRSLGMEGPPSPQTTGWAKQCQCATDDTRPCLVLDPFSGAGTTGLVALKLGRDYIGLELNESYAEMSAERIRDELGTLFVTGGVVAPEGCSRE